MHDVSFGEYMNPLIVDLWLLFEMDRHRDVQTNSGLAMLVVVPDEELAYELTKVANEAEPGEEGTNKTSAYSIATRCRSCH